MADVMVFCLFLCPLYIFKQPADFSCGKVRGELQPCFFPYLSRHAADFFSLADLRRPRALPYNGVIGRLSGFPLPHDAGFPLVADANSRHLVGVYLCYSKNVFNHLNGILINFLPVVGNPALTVHNLFMRQIRPHTQLALFIKKKRLGSLCALVDTDNIFSGMTPCIILYIMLCSLLFHMFPSLQIPDYIQKIQGNILPQIFLSCFCSYFYFRLSPDFCSYFISGFPQPSLQSPPRSVRSSQTLPQIFR